MYARKRLGQTVHLFCKSNTAQVRASLPSDFPDPPLKARRDDPSVMVWYESSGMSEDSQLQTLGVEGSIHSESSSQLEWGGYGDRWVVIPEVRDADVAVEATETSEKHT